MKYDKPTIILLDKALRLIDCQEKALLLGWDARDSVLDLVFDLPAYGLDE